MSSPSIVFAMTSALLALASIAAFLIYIAIRYTPIIGRIFEETPMFLPLRVRRAEEGEDVTFATADGLKIAGTYLKSRTSSRAGVVVFCHEYLSNRWSALPYVDHLRDQGFDLFTFDFRNHGESDSDPIYKPLQWVTEHEVFDLQAALAYLKGRSDRDPAGVGLFGVSRGGGTALCAAATDTDVWGVITDGAFPTRGTVTAYCLRWAEIYVGNPLLWKYMPNAVFEYLGWAARVRTQIKLHCRYPDVERAVRQVTPRPWLMIHGQKDAYIGLPIAKGLFNHAGDPKELWVVEGAKHNRCREKAPVEYARRVTEFAQVYAPRRPVVAEVAAPTSVSAPIDAFDALPSRINLDLVSPGPL